MECPICGDILVKVKNTSRLYCNRCRRHFNKNLKER